jgi:hypothetical protein
VHACDANMIPSLDMFVSGPLVEDGDGLDQVIKSLHGIEKNSTNQSCLAGVAMFCHVVCIYKKVE